MKRITTLSAILLAAVAASAATTTQKFSAGWDNFGEPLNFTKSNVKWSVSSTRKLTVTYTLVGATPSKLYQVALNFFCTTFPATFGQFPTDLGGGTCFSLTRHGVTATVAEVEVGVVTTDIHGNGSFTVVIGPIASGNEEKSWTVGRVAVEQHTAKENPHSSYATGLAAGPASLV